MVNLFFKRRSENRARHPWGGFALANDLELQQAPAEVRMTGHIESRRIVITGVQSRPESETARVTICVDLLAPLPEGFELVRMADPVAKSGGATSSDPLASYRRNWTVTGVDRDLAEDFLTPPRACRHGGRSNGSAAMPRWEFAMGPSTGLSGFR